MKYVRLLYVVDPDAAIVEALTTLLATHGIRVQSFPDAGSFLKALPSLPAQQSCVLVEASLPGRSGLSLVRALRHSGSKLVAILVSDRVDPDLRLSARRAGAVDVLEKPLIIAFLVARLAKLLPGASSLVGTNKIGLRNGTDAVFRTMGPEDAEIEQAFVRGLSVKSRHLRFFSGMNELSPSMLERFTHPNYPASNAFIATDVEAGKERLIGVARYAPTSKEGTSEFAVVVADDRQGLGIAGRLMSGLIASATVAGIQELEGLVLRENTPMLNLARRLDFTTTSSSEGPTVVRVVKNLRRIGKLAELKTITKVIL